MNSNSLFHIPEYLAGRNKLIVKNEAVSTKIVASHGKSMLMDVVSTNGVRGQNMENLEVE
jgi:hypothetical protein